MVDFEEDAKRKLGEARIPESRWNGLIATSRRLASAYGTTATRMLDGIIDNHRRKLHK